ncbi:thiamine-binding protein [Ohtaekwangia sp.]|uniref:thiamine-binding protein n=1 Tax=Ohtaekwangia sp. TaxID=2066019 RepID=UPI002FDDFDA8
MNHTVHIAIQIVPITDKPHYAIIDKAIEVIDRSGVSYKVGAMETVMQGDYDTLMRVAKEAQQACLEAGADEVAVTLKVHARKHGNVSWDEKGIDRGR